MTTSTFHQWVRAMSSAEVLSLFRSFSRTAQRTCLREAGLACEQLPIEGDDHDGEVAPVLRVVWETGLLPSNMGLTRMV